MEVVTSEQAPSGHVALVMQFAQILIMGDFMYKYVLCLSRGTTVTQSYSNPDLMFSLPFVFLWRLQVPKMRHWNLQFDIESYRTHDFWLEDAIHRWRCDELFLAVKETGVSVAQILDDYTLVWGLSPRGRGAFVAALSAVMCGIHASWLDMQPYVEMTKNKRCEN